MSLEGSQAPEFELETTNGATVSLSETLADGPTVISINRGHWCSFCAEQLATFSRVYEDLQFNHGVDVLPQTDAGGTTGISGVYVVDEDGEVVFEHVAEDLTDRVYGNYVRYFVADEYGSALEDPGF